MKVKDEQWIQRSSVDLETGGREKRIESGGEKQTEPESSMRGVRFNLDRLFKKCNVMFMVPLLLFAGGDGDITVSSCLQHQEIPLQQTPSGLFTKE